jgi:hypothetical protein
MSCVFCGRPKTTKEHVFPRWLNAMYPEGVLHVWSPPADSTSEPREWRTRLIEYKAKAVCGPCNGGWMSRLEVSARPHLELLMRDTDAALHDEARHQIALWSLKTALTTDLAKEADHLTAPASDFTALYEAQDVLPETFVWLGRTIDADGGSATHRRFNVDAGAVKGVDGWHASLHVGYLVIHVTRLAVGPGHVELGSNRSEALLRLWPQADPITWPPEKSMTRAQIHQLAVLIEESPMILIPPGDDGQPPSA